MGKADIDFNWILDHLHIPSKEIAVDIYLTVPEPVRRNLNMLELVQNDDGAKRKIAELILKDIIKKKEIEDRKVEEESKLDKGRKILDYIDKNLKAHLKRVSEKVSG